MNYWERGGEKMKKHLIIPIFGLALLGFVAYGSAKVYAEDELSQYPPIVQKLVERFGLNEEEVKAVFDEEREERQIENQTRFEDKLSEAVENGDLTEDQKQLILTKKAEVQEKPGELEGLSLEERRTVMEKHKKEMESWAEENGIDLKYLFGGRGFGPGRPFGGFE